MPLISVHITCRDPAEARRIATALVEERLAACVNIVPGVESFYSWNGKIQKDSEVMMLAKTRSELYRTLVKRVIELHSYKLPAIFALPARASPTVARWVRSSVRTGPARR